jgi:hypothetical protein
METVYLPKHLLIPFFDQKKILYTFGDGPEQSGWLSLTVFADGSVSLQLYSVATAQGVVHGAGQTLTADMLEGVSWDSTSQTFRGVFSKKTA